MRTDPDFYINQYRNATPKIEYQPYQPSSFDYSGVDGSAYQMPQTSAADFQNLLQGYLNNWTQSAVNNPMGALQDFSNKSTSGHYAAGGK